jgi:hypothetical protein
MLRTPYYIDSLLTDGYTVVSHTHRPRYPIQIHYFSARESCEIILLVEEAQSLWCGTVRRGWLLWQPRFVTSHVACSWNLAVSCPVRTGVSSRPSVPVSQLLAESGEHQWCPKDFLYAIVSGVHTIKRRVSLCCGKVLFPRHLGSIFRADYARRIFYLQIVTTSRLMLTIRNLLFCSFKARGYEYLWTATHMYRAFHNVRKTVSQDCFHSSTQIGKCFDTLSCIDVYGNTR